MAVMLTTDRGQRGNKGEDTEERGSQGRTRSTDTDTPTVTKIYLENLLPDYQLIKLMTLS